MYRTPDVYPRRQPQQVRSGRRVRRILDAAIHVFAEVGLRSATTTLIASRAEVSVGSLYQYFPNKDAILQAISDRFDRDFLAVLHQEFPGNPAEPAAHLVDRLLVRLVEMDASQPGLFRVLAAASHSVEFLSAEGRFNASVAEHVARLLKGYAPRLSPHQLLIVSRVCVEATHAVVHLAALAEVDAQGTFLGEARSLLLAYLQPALAIDPGEARDVDPTL